PTATAVDDEMSERIAQHRARRPSSWFTLEVTHGLAEALAQHRDVTTVIVEDLTLLLSNHMERDSVSAESVTCDEISHLMNLDANLIVVTNEVGMGLVPPYPLGRAFRDSLGRVNQRAARICQEAYLVVA